MNAMNYDRKTLKERAKASMRGIQPRPWKPTLVYLLIASILPMVVSMITQMVSSGGLLGNMMELSARLDAGYYMDEAELTALVVKMMSPVMATGVLSFFVSILMSLVQTVMGYGYKGYSLKLYRGEQTAVKDVFSGFYMAGRAICTSIMVGIFTTLWMLLAAVLAVCAILILTVALAAAGGSGGLTLLFILVYLGIIAFAVFISYRYSLAPYFILTTDMGTMDAIRESKNAMRGNIGRRFMLDLSFLGWALLESLIICVVVYGGIFITLFAVGFNMAMSGAMPEYMDAAMTASVMTQFMGGFYVSVVVGVLAALPLSLWLTPYQGAAEAGFFLIVTGQDDAPAAPQSAPEYIPPQPSGIWDNVPTPPPFTPSAPVAPEAPAAPVTAEETSAPAPEQSAEAEVKPEEVPAPAPEQPAEPEVKPEEAPAEPEIQPEETPVSEEAAPPKEDGEA